MGSGRKSEEKTKLVGSDGLRKRNQRSYGSVHSEENLKGDDEVDGSTGKTTTSRGECIYISIVLVIAVIGIVVGEATLIPIALDKIERTKNCLISVDPGVYPEAAIATDDSRCSNIARDALLRDGSAVDAAIAALLCIGVVVPQSTGIGGGHFMTIYDKDNKKAITLNAREKAPALATQQMYNAQWDLTEHGGMAIAVPGEISGMWMAHQRFGRLPWSSLFEESIQLCRNGAKVGAPLAHAMQRERENIANNTALRAIFWNANTSDVYKEGELLKRPKYGDTLQRIALRGEEEFYEGETAKILAKDIKDAGGVLNTDDLKDYEASWTDPLQTTINGMSAFGPPAPSSTSYLYFILNVLEGYNLTPDNLKTTEAAVLTYHRMIETFKYGRALSTELADPKFADVSEPQNKLTSEEYADEIRKGIDDDKTYDPPHYDKDVYTPPTDYGTSHLSILAPDGSAVAITSSINTYFGSQVVSPSTGIILNNEMNDFSTNSTSASGAPPASNNYIQPGKQPLSSMTPIIMVNTTSGNATAIIGGSGGTLIPTSMAQVAALKLWLGKKTHEAVAEPRLVHKLYPNTVQYEMDFSKDIIDGLEKKGHVTKPLEGKTTSAVNAIFHTTRCVTAASDPRKGGLDGAVGF